MCEQRKTKNFSLERFNFFSVSSRLALSKFFYYFSFFFHRHVSGNRRKAMTRRANREFHFFFSILFPVDLHMGRDNVLKIEAEEEDETKSLSTRDFIRSGNIKINPKELGGAWRAALLRRVFVGDNHLGDLDDFPTSALTLHHQFIFIWNFPRDGFFGSSQK